ncbi:efflux RND transporter periplasmic adaptor subunit [Neptuniibacter halophilus]|uniref:efflux RND transporter periplasmic adaptor subunit n=1 Tax=Neptuniibacter halophilus TaxID=651666 RepID=UPI002572B7DD|nr:efflux RND transporter periplasmic adaptor subunit [Neptuniibacter halophilus]
MKRFFLLTLALLSGTGIGYLLANYQSGGSTEGASAEAQPLYWVAPMDPNYKRDQPGLSPMGMELIPVYAEDLAGDSPGTVSISPEVVNNLGVRTEPVLFSPLQPIHDTVGYVGFDQEQLEDIHSRVSGWVETLAVNTEGEPVREGQLLYEIYSPELVNAQEEYLAAVQSGNGFLRQASVSKLQALGFSEKSFAQLKQQRSALTNVPVYAPKSGYVSQLNLRQGGYIQPASKLMRIGPLDQVWVTAELFERQAVQVQAGDVAEMRLPFMPGKVWRGQVDYIYPALDAKTRTLKVRLRFANPDLILKPDMFARIRIQPRAGEPVLSVPASALIKTGTQQRVVVALGEGRYKSVAVESGARINDRVPVFQGLLPTDQVVVSAQFLLDSESAISSDFMRMSEPGVAVPDEVWVSASVEELDREARRLLVSHQPIPQWQQGAMQMYVPVEASLDLEPLTGAGEVQLLLRGGNMSNLQLVDYLLPQPKAPGSLPGGSR